VQRITKNPISLLPALVLWVSLSLFSACQPEQPSREPEVLPADHYFTLQLAGQPIAVQLALTEGEQTRGLMHRPSLQANHGMLFVFPETDRRAFWMRNTSIPLDLAYIDPTGRVLEVHALFPYDERAVPSRSNNVSLVLEMARGWFKKNQLGPGNQINCLEIQEAIQSRGFDPKNFALTRE